MRWLMMVLLALVGQSLIAVENLFSHLDNEQGDVYALDDREKTVLIRKIHQAMADVSNRLESSKDVITVGADVVIRCDQQAGTKQLYEVIGNGSVLRVTEMENGKRVKSQEYSFRFGIVVLDWMERKLQEATGKQPKPEPTP